MRNIDILTEKIETLFSEGQTLEDFSFNVFGTIVVETDKVVEGLFGEPQQVIVEFEKNFAGKASDDLVNHLVKAGRKMLGMYESLLRQELAAVTPSLSQIVSAQMNGGIDLDEITNKRVRVSEKWFAVVMAMRQLDELHKDIKELGPKAEKLLANRCYKL